MVLVFSFGTVWWEKLVLLCDAHTHFFSRAFFELLAKQAVGANGGDVESRLDAVREKAGIEIPDTSPSDHAKRWLTEFDRNGVDQAVTFASVPGEAASVLEAASISSGRLIPYLMCDASSAAGIDSAVNGLCEGFRGVLLFPAVHGDPSDPALDGLYEEAAAKKAPVVVHCGVLQIRLRDLLGVRPRYDLRAATPVAVSTVAERHRQTTFVIPHFGGGFFRETLLAGAQSSNVFVDTSSSNSWIATQPGSLNLTEVYRQTLAVFGAQRVLFGTDSSTFPRGWRHDLFSAQETAVEALELDPADKNCIFGENLQRLLGG